jgi:glucose/mannose-6-phosphate isomerase
MEKAIRNFPKQFSFSPQVENASKLKQYRKFVVVGMGGSALAGSTLQSAKPDLDLKIHKNYNLPFIKKEDEKETLIIASSYSGNTEETLSGYVEAKKRKIDLAALSVGGKLIELAKKDKNPFVIIPNTGIQPRMTFGFNLLGLLKLTRSEKDLKIVSTLEKKLKVSLAEKRGKQLAEILWDKIPVIYSSESNLPIAYNWKIKFNETTKIPAFYNILPELNHNEMTGFDFIKTTQSLNDKFHFVFLNDSSDHHKIKSRFKVLQKLFQARSIGVSAISLEGKNIWEKICSNLLVADWTAFYLARYYGVEAEQVPMVEEFKKLIK